MKVAIIIPPALKTASFPAEMMLKGVVLDRLYKEINVDIFDLNSEARHNTKLSDESRKSLELFLNSNKKSEKEILEYLQGENNLINLAVIRFIGNLDMSKYDLITIGALEREHAKLGLCFAKHLKEKTGKPIVFGSISDSMSYDAYRVSHLIGHFDFIDVLIDKTKGWDIFLNFLNNYGTNKLDEISGLIFRKDREIIRNPGYKRLDKDKFVYDINQINPPLGLDNKIIKNCNFIPYEIGRGCKNNCFFCNVNYFPYIMKSPEKVVSEIGKLIDEYSIRNFVLSCSSINKDKKWLSGFLAEIKSNNLEFSWITMAIPKNLDKDTLKDMADCGCVNLHFGLETRSNNRLQGLDKEIKIEEIEEIFRDCKEVGICSRALFIVGFPHESKKEIDQIEEYIRNNHQLFASIDIQTFKLKSDCPLFLDKEGMKKVGICPREKGVFDFNYIPYDEVNGLNWEEKLKDNFRKRDHLLGICNELGIARSSIEGVNKNKENLFILN